MVSFFGDEIDDIRTGTLDTKIPATEVFFYHTDSPHLPQVGLKLRAPECTDTCLVGFDLDFWTIRKELFSSAASYIAFESQGIPLGIEPWTTENLDTFADFLRSNPSTQVRILSAHPVAIERFLEHNSLAHTIEQVPRLGISSMQSAAGIIIADDVLGRLFTEKRTKRQTMRALDLLVSLRPGDYIVHVDHGVGIFRAMIEKEISGISREYIEIEYAKSDILYVPITELYRITKYFADDAPTLHILGGKEWKKTMNETEVDILKTAEELLELSAQRKLES